MDINYFFSYLTRISLTKSTDFMLLINSACFLQLPKSSSMDSAYGSDRNSVASSPSSGFDAKRIAGGGRCAKSDSISSTSSQVSALRNRFENAQKSSYTRPPSLKPKIPFSPTINKLPQASLKQNYFKNLDKTKPVAENQDPSTSAGKVCNGEFSKNSANERLDDNVSAATKLAGNSNEYIDDNIDYCKSKKLNSSNESAPSLSSECDIKYSKISCQRDNQSPVNTNTTSVLIKSDKVYHSLTSSSSCGTDSSLRRNHKSVNITNHTSCGTPPIRTVNDSTKTEKAFSKFHSSPDRNKLFLNASKLRNEGIVSNSNQEVSPSKVDKSSTSSMVSTSRFSSKEGNIVSTRTNSVPITSNSIIKNIQISKKIKNTKSEGSFVIPLLKPIPKVTMSTCFKEKVFNSVKISNDHVSNVELSKSSQFPVIDKSASGDVPSSSHLQRVLSDRNGTAVAADPASNPSHQSSPLPDNSVPSFDPPRVDLHSVHSVNVELTSVELPYTVNILPTIDFKPICGPIIDDSVQTSSTEQVSVSYQANDSVEAKRAVVTHYTCSNDKNSSVLNDHLVMDEHVKITDHNYIQSKETDNDLDEECQFDESDDEEEGAQIISGPDDIIVTKGQSATLTISFCGNPPPEVTWLKKVEKPNIQNITLMQK